MAFNSNFMWGVAIASHQNDGGAPGSDWTAAEAAGRYPHRSDHGNDFRRRFAEDFERLKHEVGGNTIRFSLEWARLEPTPGTWDQGEVRHVHAILTAAKALGLKVVATLHHFTSPQWIHGERRGGWEDLATAKAFERYARFVAIEFGGAIDYYLTFNEPSNMIIGGYMAAKIPPFRWGPLAMISATRVVLDAHERAYAAIHSERPGAMVSYSEFASVVAVGGWGLDYHPAFASRLLHGTRPRLDFMSVHFYGNVPVQEAGEYPLRPYLFAPRPAAFARMLRQTYQAYGLPILVGENGMATNNHAPRADGYTACRYLEEHVEAMAEVAADGVPLLGYLWWTLVDNYEWGSFDSRFGLYRADCHAGRYDRVATPTVATFRNVIGRYAGRKS